MGKIDEISEDVVAFARRIFGEDFIPLHRPVFEGNERQYLVDCIDSNFVSSVGAKVSEFEQLVAKFTGSKHAIATVNGTAALHIAIELAGVKPGDEVISQALTFIATCNAISYAGADPLFVDVDVDTMGLSPVALKRFLEENGEKRASGTFNKTSGKKISACVPMHTFGFPCRIAKIAEICADWNIALIEDAAESLGSYAGGRHTGTFASMATLSFQWK
jgi:perosamine synthetase